MISVADLLNIAIARWQDAEVLSSAGRYDSAFYLCGYCVELSLKARFCRALNWSAFPSTNAEFKSYVSLRTHDLEVLLHLSSVEVDIKAKYWGAWLIVTSWSPGARYRSIGTTNKRDALDMLVAARELMEAL